jgi:hypothetical protein
MESDGEPATPPPGCPHPRCTAEQPKAAAIHRHLARGNISKAASRLDFDQIALPTPSVLQQLQDLRMPHLQSVLRNLQKSKARAPPC